MAILVAKSAKAITQGIKGMMHRRNIAVAGAACALLLAACTPDEGPVSRPASTTAGVGLAANATPVSPARAKAIFDNVCGASLPNFATASKRMTAQGFTRSSPLGTGTIYSATENASIQINGKTCSLVVATKASADAMRAAVMGPAAGPSAGHSGVDFVAMYPGGRAVVTSGMITRELGDLTFINFKMLAR
jgi:hypothetical protein